ncbi:MULTISPECIES: integrase [unclassified Archaeoglobus]|uniref:integrase n=3 Tax=Archaeoglobus TaxID=2233 RepID=UPI0025BDDE4D|nr:MULTISPECIES: integrase [unclassified Archaeoglobus]
MDKNKIAVHTIKFDEIDKTDFILYWTSERKQKTSEKRAEKLYKVLNKVLKGKEVNLESLREGFHNTTNKKDYVNAARVLLEYLKVRKLMDKSEVEEILEQPFLTVIKSNKVRIPGIATPKADEHVAEVYQWIKKKWKDEETEILYKLMVYSGIRLEHAYRMMKTFNPANLEFNGKVARYPTSDVSTHIKGSFYAFMPAEFAKKLRRLELPLDVQSYENRINPKRWRPPKEEWQNSWINAKNIRKWFENFCKRNGVEILYRKFFMGHSTRAVIEHYEQMEDLSWSEYRKIVDSFPISP